MTCASFLADATGGKILNPESHSRHERKSSDTLLNAENNFNAAYQQAGGTGISPCIGLLQQAATYAANNNFVGTTTKQPTYLPFGEAPIACLNPVMLKIVNTFVPAVVNSTGGLAVTRSASPTGDKNLLVRSDYLLNGQHSFDARYDLINSNSFGPLGVNSSSIGVATYAILAQKAVSNFGNVGWSWVMTPNLLNRTSLWIQAIREHTQLPTDNRTLNDFGGNFVATGHSYSARIQFFQSVCAWKHEPGISGSHQRKRRAERDHDLDQGKPHDPGWVCVSSPPVPHSPGLSRGRLPSAPPTPASALPTACLALPTRCRRRTGLFRAASSTPSSRGFRTTGE